MNGGVLFTPGSGPVDVRFMSAYPVVLVACRDRQARSQFMMGLTQGLLAASTYRVSLHADPVRSGPERRALAAQYPTRVGFGDIERDETDETGWDTSGNEQGVPARMAQVFDGADALMGNERFERITAIGGPVLIGVDSLAGTALPALLRRSSAVLYAGHETVGEVAENIVHWDKGATQAWVRTVNQLVREQSTSTGFNSMLRQVPSDDAVAEQAGRTMN